MSKKKDGQNAAAAPPSERQKLSKRTRNEATLFQTVTRPTDVQPAYDVPYITKTPDEDNPKFKNYAASFHKLFVHDPDTGLLTDGSGVPSYKNLLKGLNNPDDPANPPPNSDFDWNALNDIELAPTNDSPPRVLVNPQSSKALTIKGGDIAAFRFKAQPVTDRRWQVGYEVAYAPASDDTEDLLDELSLSSRYSAAEMVEVYAMALLRDIDFDVYSIPNPDVQLAIDALNVFGANFRGPKERVGSAYRVTAKTLFRGNSPESLRGDYLSKYLLLRRPPLFASGCVPGTADLINAGIFFGELAESMTAPQPNPRREFGLTWDNYVKIQNRQTPQKYQPGDFKGKVLISNGRNLASLVHVDGLYQEHAWAVDVLTAGNYKTTLVSPYSNPLDRPGFHSRNEGGGPTLGAPDAASLVGAVAIEAARLAWSQKYLVARRARPEVFAALIHKRKNGGSANVYGPINQQLLNNPTVGKLLNRIRQENEGRGGPDASTYLLSQVFPEASPAHPSWPSGHATVAGACVTVIKAIFDDQLPLLQQIDGSPPFTDEDGVPLTVGGELDKLASNIALGRNFGGVHYRSDGEHGILLGESLALRFLQDHLRTYRERFRCDSSPDGTDPCFELSLRSGERVRLTKDEVIPLPPMDAEAAKAKAGSSVRMDRTVI
ncbi:MAG: vanadium-dependent haloperoxidase [Blastocatellia bacterium]